MGHITSPINVQNSERFKITPNQVHAVSGGARTGKLRASGRGQGRGYEKFCMTTPSKLSENAENAPSAKFKIDCCFAHS